MNNLNTVLVEGLLTRDPERMGPEGSSMCRMGLANNRYYFSDKEGRWIPDTSFFTIQVYGSAAESCMRRLKKGRGIRVVGRLKQYVTKHTNLEKVYILAEHIEVQPQRVTEKQEIPEMEKLQGLPTATTNMQELDKEEEEERKAQQIRECKDAEAEIIANETSGVEDGKTEEAPKVTPEIVETNTEEEEEKEEEEYNDAF